MKYLIVYHQRLGDIIHLFAGAKHLADQGHEVLIECYHRYHDIFECVDYVKPTSPFIRPRVDKVLDLQVYDYSAPDGGVRYKAYRARGVPWGEFVYDGCEELASSYGPPHFSKLFDCDVDDRPVVAPYGYSQNTPTPPQIVIDMFHQRFGPEFYVLTDSPHLHGQNRHLYVRRLRELPGLIKTARQFLTINTCTSIIAAGVRPPGSYDHIREPYGNFQDDTLFEGRPCLV